MKKLLTFTVILLSLIVRAQDNEQQHPVPITETYQYFDSAWQPTKEKKAVYLLRIRQMSDTCWQYEYYNMYGPLIRVETYKDQAATIRHGFFAWYNEAGKIDSSDHLHQGLKYTSWSYPGLKNVSYPQRHDTIIEIESEFPGGGKAWFKYLGANERYPERALKKRIMGSPTVSFIISQTGEVIDVTLEKSAEISLDDEAIRVIQHSPRWTPAIQNGRPVKSYKKQPIVFKM